MPVYDPASGAGRLLVLDLDQGRGDVDAQAAELGRLLEQVGARHVADTSPSGGRHVYVLFSQMLPWLELRDLARAITLRFPAADPAPMASLGGQISPPGARHKRGGWRLLAMPLVAARTAVERPNGPEVWGELLEEFAAELQQGRARPGAEEAGSLAELDSTGTPWVPHLGGRAPLSAGLDHTARTGQWDRAHYPGRSEARMAVLAAAATRGWRLADVQAAVGSGAWRGLAQLYERRSEPGRIGRLLPAEWRKTIVYVSGLENARNWLTSALNSRPPAGTGADEFAVIRQWATALGCAAADPERIRGWGRSAIAVRQLLAAIAQAAMVSGSTVIEFGSRNLALHSGLSQRTAARLLQMLRTEPDPLLDLVTPRRAARADRYQLRIPDRYADSARWRRRRAGRINGIHPCFLVLGGAAALVYEVLDGTETRATAVARAARLSPTAAAAALRILAEHGLAGRSRGGWHRGGAELDDVAESTGAAEIHQARAEQYKRDRDSWRARLRQYQAARIVPVGERDGWLSLDDPDEYDFMVCRWPVLADDAVRAPPASASRESA